VTGSFNLAMLVSSELYPTNLRSQAVGFCSTISRLFGLCCPFVASLAVYWKPLPMVTIGLPIMLASILVLFGLPDSSGELPQSFHAAMENLERQKREENIDVES
jgi:OCT family organic cation transporter-like MFS transporter 4/5